MYRVTFLYTQLLDYRFGSPLKFFDDVNPHMHHFYFSVLLSVLILFFSSLAFLFPSRKQVHHRVSWYINATLIWVCLMAKFVK